MHTPEHDQAATTPATSADYERPEAAASVERCPSCGNAFGGDNLCMVSACQWEGVDRPAAASLAAPVYRVVVYRNDEMIFHGSPRPDDAEDFLTVSRLGGQPARLECSVPDLSAGARSV